MADMNQTGFQNGNQQIGGYMNPNQSIGYPNNMGTPVMPNNGRNLNMYGGNPYNNISMNTYDNYLNQQNRGMGLMQQPQQNINTQNQFFKCRPVSSEEEARASQIDLDGSLWVFTDIGNKKMYTKQINNDGTATFKIYECTKDESPYASLTPSTEYVTKE